MVEFLLDNGANPNIGTSNEYTPDFYTERVKAESPLYFLASNTWSRAPLSLEKKIEYIQLLLSKNADVNTGSEEFLEKFEYSGIPHDVFAGTAEKTSMGTEIKTITPLFAAIKALKNNDDDYSIVQLLLDNGAEANKGELFTNEKNSEKNYHDSPLYKAVEKNLTHVFKLLINKGALPNLKIGKEVPHYLLYLAIHNKNIEILKILLENGVDPKANGEKFLWAASGNEEMTALLKSYGAVATRPEPALWFYTD